MLTLRLEGPPHKCQFNSHSILCIVEFNYCLILLLWWLIDISLQQTCLFINTCIHKFQIMICILIKTILWTPDLSFRKHEETVTEKLMTMKYQITYTTITFWTHLRAEVILKLTTWNLRKTGTIKERWDKTLLTWSRQSTRPGQLTRE